MNLEYYLNLKKNNININIQADENTYSNLL